MREGWQILPPSQRAGLLVPALRPPHSSDGWDPFAKSRTPLQKWFYAMYMFTTTRHGVAAKELQRQLGVTYKTAWRMGHELRKYMAVVDGETPLSSPLKKALLTEFDSTAKHNATKAVSPSSETMRTI